MSWIDPITGLPEVDHVSPPPVCNRTYLTTNSGFRFCNFLEVWADYDQQLGSVIGHGFTNASGIYRALSYGGIPSQVFRPIRNVKVGTEPITYMQTIGARTQSPEVIGGMVGDLPGSMVASAITAFPPIWSELQIAVFNNGRFGLFLLRHSIFPSLTLYKLRMDGSGNPTGTYDRVNINGRSFYDAVPGLDRWKKEGWGIMRGATYHTSGPTSGNPWNFEKTLLSGYDMTGRDG